MIKLIVIILCLQQLVASMTTRPDRLISYAIPENRQLKIDLGYYEDSYLNFTELTTKYGYSSEEYAVTTEDGYVLTIFRILPKCEQRYIFPVILGHGLYANSDTWLVTGPETSLGYYLSNNCYDTWTANFRGNNYSRKHLRWNPDKDPDYWEFSFDEMGNYDLPAVIDYVLNVTRQSQVYYIGYSSGSTIFFTMGSLKPKYNDKIRLSIQVAPITWIKNVKIPIANAIALEGDKIKEILDNIGIKEVLAKQQIMHTLTELVCQFLPHAVCGTFLSKTSGYVQRSITSKNLAVAMGHLFVGASFKTIAHYGQLLVSGKFQRYNEGKEGNIKRYGTINPPAYNVSLITSPIVLVGAENDMVSNLKDLNILSARLPNIVDKYIVPDPTWSHHNHVWSVKATEYVNEKILTYFDKFNT